MSSPVPVFAMEFARIGDQDAVVRPAEGRPARCEPWPAAMSKNNFALDGGRAYSVEIFRAMAARSAGAPVMEELRGRPSARERMVVSMIAAAPGVPVSGHSHREGYGAGGRVRMADGKL